MMLSGVWRAPSPPALCSPPGHSAPVFCPLCQPPGQLLGLSLVTGMARTPRTDRRRELSRSGHGGVAKQTPRKKPRGVFTNGAF